MGSARGKSAVAKRLAELGAVVIDADKAGAREVVAAGTDGLAAVVEAFGSGVLGPDGELDRPATGDEGLRVTTPPASSWSRSSIRGYGRGRPNWPLPAAPDAIVVNDVPLLVETGLAPTYQLVIVVRADAETRIARLVQTRGDERGAGGRADRRASLR